MFVVLVGLAFAAYAPAALMPVLEDYARTWRERERLGEYVRRLEEAVEQQERLAAAFRSDPAVNERLAQLDLRYQHPGEEVVPLLPATNPASADGPGWSALGPDADDRLVPPHGPPWVLWLEAAARERGLLRLMRDPSIRTVLLLMAAGLMIAAFVLYPPGLADRPQP